MNPGHNRRDVLADDAEDGERVLPITYRLAKVFGGGVMRREVRISQAGSPPGLDGTGGLAVQNFKRCMGPVQHGR